MSDTPRPDSSSDIPTAPPKDLYLTSDIRLVMIDMAKLTTKVDRLISDVEKLGGKVEALGNKIEAIGKQMSFFIGAFWIASAVFGVCVLALGWLFTTHTTITFH